MPSCMPSRRLFGFIGVFLFLATAAFAQFTASIQGVVQDQSGAGVAKVKVDLLNTATGVITVATTDESGNYRFISLAPGNYKITAESAGFSKSEATVTLLTEQNLNVPLSLKVGSVSESVIVSTEAPIVDTADSRVQMTLENQGVAQLPIIGRNLVTLVTMAPGVSGLGTSTSGSPASGVDNFSTEEQVDASANGQGQNNNQYIIDGLDVTSGIRQGVLNLTPQPDSIQETSVQVNTFSVEHSRAAGLQTIFTTKSGSDSFHGSASDYFNYQGMFANQHFVSSSTSPYKPFHSNNFDFSVGGPIIPHHNSFFYFAVEPLRSSASAGGSVTFRRSTVHRLLPSKFSEHGRNPCAEHLFAFWCWRRHGAANGPRRLWFRPRRVRNHSRTKWRACALANDRSGIVRRHPNPKRHAIFCSH